MHNTAVGTINKDHETLGYFVLKDLKSSASDITAFVDFSRFEDA